jgi:galactokinase
MIIVKCKSAILIHHSSRTTQLNEFRMKHFVLFYRSGSFDIENFSISYEKANWFEYFKCGIQGIHDKFPDIKLKGMKKISRKKILISNYFLGMKVLIDGTIPLSAGLSSSSALVVCAALTTVIANGVNIGKVYIFILFASYFILLFLESFGRSLC